jgi:hypothetical protein
MQLLPNFVNSSYHYAIGDICDWSGIKRCGAAMSMGYHAATNIYQKLVHESLGLEPKYMLFPADVPPMIAIALGKTAIMHSPVDGNTSGEAVLEMMFRNDLGFASKLSSPANDTRNLHHPSVCWNYLQLGVDPTVPVISETLTEKEKDLNVEVAIVDAAAELEATSL